MVQFHPTGLSANGVLLSESSRAEGALLVNKDGEHFMVKYAPEKKELATRDMQATVRRPMPKNMLTRAIKINCLKTARSRKKNLRK